MPQVSAGRRGTGGQNMRSLHAAILCLALVLAGCGGPDAPDPRSTPQLWRLIEEDPETLFDRGWMLKTEEVAHWEFTGPADLVAWKLNLKQADFALEPEGLVPISGKQFMTLRRPLGLDAAEIDAFEVRLTNPARRPMVFEWAGPRQRFGQERRIEVDPGSTKGPLTVRFPTRGHPEWRGDIQTVRLTLIVARQGKATLHSIRALRETAHPEHLAALTTRFFKVDLGSDARNAVVAVPGVPRTGQLVVPEKAMLTFALGLQGRPQPVTFRVKALDPRHQDAVPEVLFEETLGGEQMGRWHRRRLDLSAHGGRHLQLTFETSIEGEVDPRLGLPVWANPEVRGPRDGRPNVILISLDTLRPDHLSLYGYPRSTSPHIDAWARSRGVVFEQAIAAAPWTLPSHTSIFTGLDAHRHGVNYEERVPGSLLLLPEILRGAGYATSAVTGGAYLAPGFGLIQGFDRFRTAAFETRMEDELENGLEQVLAWLRDEERSSRPFFLFFHTYEIHAPYRPRAPYFHALSGAESDPELYVNVESLPPLPGQFFGPGQQLALVRRGKVLPAPPELMQMAIDRYDSGIAYADAAIGRLLGRLAELDLERRTVVVLTSDHGEHFGEHGLLSHVSLYEENLRVPLVIALPEELRGGSLEGRRIEEQVRSIDLLPTLLDLVGMAPPPNLDGVSLRTLLAGESRREEGAGRAWSYAANSNFGISLRIDNRSKYILRNSVWSASRPVEEVFDLGRDPAEARTLTEHSEQLAPLRNLARDALSLIPGLRLRLSNRLGSQPLTVRWLEGDPSSLRRLKALTLEQIASLDKDTGKASFRVEPGESLDLSLEIQNPGPLSFQLTRGDGMPFTVAVDPEALAGVWHAHPEDAAWRVEELEELAGDGMFLWWHGRFAGPTDSPEELDPALRERLEALGYL